MSEVAIDGLADTAGDVAERDRQAAIYEVLEILPKGESSGVCSDCGQPIEPLRLALLPGTTECSACAQISRRLAAPIHN